MSTLSEGRVIGFDDVSCGEFFIWLFDYAEEQSDEDYAEIHKFYDWLAPLFADYLHNL